MKKVAKFEKVSFQQFKNDWIDTFENQNFSDDEIKQTYDSIVLPKRATLGSAGYDFFLPLNVELKPNETLKVPTGIRVSIEEGWVLKVYPRSGLGFKFRLQLDNTVGIIDSDYYNAKNEGHIFLKITNDTNKDKCVSLNKGEGFAQGIFVEYGITFDDEVSAIREGGFGSTTKK